MFMYVCIQYLLLFGRLLGCGRRVQHFYIALVSVRC